MKKTIRNIAFLAVMCLAGAGQVCAKKEETFSFYLDERGISNYLDWPGQGPVIFRGKTRTIFDNDPWSVKFRTLFAMNYCDKLRGLNAKNSISDCLTVPNGLKSRRACFTAKKVQENILNVTVCWSEETEKLIVEEAKTPSGIKFSVKSVPEWLRERTKQLKSIEQVLDFFCTKSGLYSVPNEFEDFDFKIDSKPIDRNKGTTTLVVDVWRKKEQV